MSAPARSVRQEFSSRRARRGAAWAVGVVVVALAAGACSDSPSGPKAKESAAKMAADVKWVAAQPHMSGQRSVPFTVTQDGTKAVSCGHGKARYTFAVHQSFAIPPGSDYLNLTTSDSEGMLANRGYTINEDVWDKETANDDSRSRMTKPLVNEKARIHLTVTATAQGDNPTTELWTVTAHTDCLRTG